MVHFIYLMGGGGVSSGSVIHGEEAGLSSHMESPTSLKAVFIAQPWDFGRARILADAVLGSHHLDFGVCGTTGSGAGFSWGCSRVCGTRGGSGRRLAGTDGHSHRHLRLLSVFLSRHLLGFTLLLGVGGAMKGGLLFGVGAVGAGGWGTTTPGAAVCYSLSADTVVILPVLMLAEGTTVSGYVTSTARLTRFSATIPATLQHIDKKYEWLKEIVRTYDHRWFFNYRHFHLQLFKGTRAIIKSNYCMTSKQQKSVLTLDILHLIDFNWVTISCHVYVVT